MYVLSYTTASGKEVTKVYPSFEKAISMYQKFQKENGCDGFRLLYKLDGHSDGLKEVTE